MKKSDEEEAKLRRKEFNDRMRSLRIERNRVVKKLKDVKQEYIKAQTDRLFKKINYED